MRDISSLLHGMKKVAIIMSLLWNSLQPEIKFINEICMFLTTANDIRDVIQQTYSKEQNAAQIYEINTKIVATK